MVPLSGEVILKDCQKVWVEFISEKTESARNSDIISFLGCTKGIIMVLRILSDLLIC